MPHTRLARGLLIGFIVVFGVLGTGYLGQSDASMFPQRYAHAFYVTKGLVAVVAVVAILWHMSSTWPTIQTAGQRLRYIALLMVTVLIASGSQAQLSENAPVAGRNIGGLMAAVLVIAAMVVSIRQDRQR